jgi:hypothetical protein
MLTRKPAKSKQQKVDSDCKYKLAFPHVRIFKFAKNKTGHVVETDAQDHKDDIDRLSPGIENNAGRKQYNVFVLKRKY